MAFVVIALVLVAKSNPDLYSDLRAKVGLKRKEDLDNLTPSLLPGNVRSEAYVRGSLEAAVTSLRRLDGLPFGDSLNTDGKQDQWEIDSGEEVVGAEELAIQSVSLDKEIGGMERAASAEQAMKFTIFDDQPESLQLCLYVRKQGDVSGKRFLATAEVSIARCLETGEDIVASSLRLHSTRQPIGRLHVSLKFTRAKRDLYEGYNSSYTSYGDSREKPYFQTTHTEVDHKKSGKKGSKWSFTNMSASLGKKFSGRSQTHPEDYVEDKDYQAFL